MSLEQKDIELVERIIYKAADDIAVSISRSFERLEERIDEAESRIHGRLREIEEAVELQTPKNKRVSAEIEEAMNELDGFGRVGEEELLAGETD